MHYRDHTKPLPEVAAEVGADMIVEGSVRRSDDRVRIIAQLIDARSGVEPARPGRYGDPRSGSAPRR